MNAHLDPATIGAAILFLASVGWAIYRAAKGPAAASAARPATIAAPVATLSTLAPSNPGRALIDHIEEIGKEAAGRHLESRLGQHYAAKHGQDIAAALGPKPAAPAPALPGPPPAPPAATAPHAGA